MRGLSKPTVAATAVNRLAHEHPAEMAAFAKAAAALCKASGGSKGEVLRAAAGAEREAAAALVSAAEADVGADGSPAVLGRVAETLQAAAADPDVEKLVVAGRLERELNVASIGFGLDVGSPSPSGSAQRQTPVDRGRGERASVAERKRDERELRERERELADLD